jgi:predicted nucleotidyltransferase
VQLQGLRDINGDSVPSGYTVFSYLTRDERVIFLFLLYIDDKDASKKKENAERANKV